MRFTRWIGEFRKHKFITPAELRVGHLALNMYDGEHYRIVEYAHKVVVRGCDTEITREYFLEGYPWTYRNNSPGYQWYPQVLRDPHNHNMYGWILEPEIGDYITDGVTVARVETLWCDAMEYSTDRKQSWVHFLNAGEPMFMQKIPVVDE